MASHPGRSGLTWRSPGTTAIDRAPWPRSARPTARALRSEAWAVIGDGKADFREAAHAVLRWGVKRASGFALSDADDGLDPGDPLRVVAGQDRTVLARMGPVRVTEPVRVIDVVDTPVRAGFSYATRRGHPIAGEEAFLVSLEPDGTVRLMVRSLTRPAPGAAALLLPVALALQPLYRRRYLRSLRRR